jgi:hypothetical protein
MLWMLVSSKSVMGFLPVLLSLSVIGVSAYVYEQAQQTTSQTILQIATLTLHNSALGNIEEGQTIFYTPSNKSDLNDIISVITTKADVYLSLESDVDNLAALYDIYGIYVRFDTIPAGSSHNPGDLACKLEISSPDYNSVVLDAAGDWTFDFEITTTAKSVNADQPTTVTITVTAKSSA